MQEQDIEFSNKGVVLKGTIARPPSADRPPLILFIHGSGPLDRDENMKLQGLNVFNDLAKSLADAGYASVRYDKRGCGESGGDYYRTGYFDLVSDALGWVEFLRSKPGFGPLYLLGHSEGTLIGSQVSLQSDAVAGLILLCPFIQPADELLRQQARTAEQEYWSATGFGAWIVRFLSLFLGKPTELQEKLIARIKTADTDSFRWMLRKFEAKALRELMSIDPYEVYSAVRVPALVFGAEKDIQCDPDDVSRIAKLLGPLATAHIETNLTHILRKDDNPPGFRAYKQQLKRPIDPSIARRITRWLDEQTIPLTAAT